MGAPILSIQLLMLASYAFDIFLFEDGFGVFDFGGARSQAPVEFKEEEGTEA